MALNRKNTSKTLSKIVSISEIIIDTISETHGKSEREVEEFFNTSRFKKQLFDIKSEYYQNDINLLLAYFEAECRDEKGWNRI